MTLQEYYQHCRQRLQGQETGGLDARLMICHVLNMTHEEFLLRSQRIMAAEEIETIDKMVAQRLQGRPVAKIIGYREFYGRRFITSEATLDPRPDSETLIVALLQQIPVTFAGKLIDLGCGTGCLGLTILAERPQMTGVLVDISPDALHVAKHNAAQLGIDRVTFVQSDWWQNVSGTFDVVISNPPYIASNDIPGLTPDVRQFDPMLALDGGADGYDAYRLLLQGLKAHMQPNAIAAFEVGQGQAEALAQMLQQSGLSDIQLHKDLPGIDRIVSARRL